MKLGDVLRSGMAAQRDKHGFIALVRPDVGGWEVSLTQKGSWPHFLECFDSLDDVLSLFSSTCAWEPVPVSTRAGLVLLDYPEKRTSRFGGGRHRMLTQEQQARFWAKVEKQPYGCWIWCGNKNSTSGFGMARVDGGRVLAHRLAYEMAYGALDLRKYVLHNPQLCSNKLCVNPAHLILSNKRSVSMENVIEDGVPAEFLRQQKAS